MRNNRGQAAIEFLITYGWAILAAMIVIGALAYFGITNPATTLPDKCVFSNGFECQEYIITGSQLNIKIINGYGQMVYQPDVNPTDGIGNCVFDGSDWGPDDVREAVCTSLTGMPFNSKDKARIKLTLNYSKTPSGYNQVALGEVYSTVQ